MFGVALISAIAIGQSTPLAQAKDLERQINKLIVNKTEDQIFVLSVNPGSIWNEMKPNELKNVNVFDYVDIAHIWRIDKKIVKIFLNQVYPSQYTEYTFRNDGSLAALQADMPFFKPVSGRLFRTWYFDSKGASLSSKVEFTLFDGAKLSVDQKGALIKSAPPINWWKNDRDLPFRSQ